MPSPGSRATGGGAGSDGSHTDLGRRVVSIGAEARYHPLGWRDIDPWLGAELGMIAFTDSVEVYGPGGRDQGGAAVTRSGPQGGLVLGLDFSTTSFLALGVELRATLQSLGHSAPLLLASTDEHAPDYGTLTAVSLGVGGTFFATP